MKKIIIILIAFFILPAENAHLYAQKRSTPKTSVADDRTSTGDSFTIMSLFEINKKELKSGKVLRSALTSLGFKIISNTIEKGEFIDTETTVYEKDGIKITENWPYEGLTISFNSRTALNSFVENAKSKGFKRNPYDKSLYGNLKIGYEFSITDNEIYIDVIRG